MYRQFIEYQMLDIAREPMEVAPTAHYTMGGVVVDPETHATEVAGLYAAGEVTAGLHGANRLGGNSLTETIITGRRAGDAAASFSSETEVVLRPHAVIRDAIDELEAWIHPGTELARPLQRRLRDLMWERCGVVRNEADLADGLRELDEIDGSLADVDVRPGAEGWSDLAQVLDLRGGLLAAEATLRGAVQRRDERGAHFRSDYRDFDPSLSVNFHGRLIDGRLSLQSVPVPAPSPELDALIDASSGVEPDAARLLE